MTLKGPQTLNGLNDLSESSESKGQGVNRLYIHVTHIFTEYHGTILHEKMTRRQTELLNPDPEFVKRCEAIGQILGATLPLVAVGLLSAVEIQTLHEHHVALLWQAVFLVPNAAAAGAMAYAGKEIGEIAGCIVALLITDVAKKP